jgi:hypothetical protein
MSFGKEPDKDNSFTSSSNRGRPPTFSNAPLIPPLIPVYE